jgi:hypothetical protein
MTGAKRLDWSAVAKKSVPARFDSASSPIRRRRALRLDRPGRTVGEWTFHSAPRRRRCGKVRCAPNPLDGREVPPLRAPRRARSRSDFDHMLHRCNISERLRNPRRRSGMKGCRSELDRSSSNLTPVPFSSSASFVESCADSSCVALMSWRSAREGQSYVERQTVLFDATP